MESELLKEPWVFPATKTRPTSSPAGPENSAFSAWEENFQDLSGWCMDLPMTWNRQYDFPTGELITPKLSDAKDKDDEVSTTEKGESKGLMGIGQEKLGTLGSHTLVAGQLQADPQPMQQYQQQLLQLEQQQYPQEKREVKCNIIDDSSDVWLNSPMAAEKNSTVAYKIIGMNDESEWLSNIKKNDTASRHEDPVNTTSEDGCIVPFDTAEDQREASVDFLHQLDVSELDTFDLLSYVCDDRTNSTEGSAMSARSTCESPNEAARAQGERKSKRVLRRPKASTSQEETLSPALPSTSRSDPSSKIAEEASRASRPRERRRNSVSSESSSRRSAQSRRGGTKRFLDSDSEDQSPHGYRESRERNNEASRKSRMNKKVKETQMSRQAAELERDNRILRMKVEELEKLVTAMRTALLRSALKKEP